MTDRELLEKRLAHVVASVETLRRRARPDQLATDPVQRGFVAHTLQTAIQAAIDVASILVSERRLPEPRTNAELFDRLAEDGWISGENAATYHRIVGFRNVVVDRYLDVDPAILREILENHLEDLLSFARAVRSRLSE